MSEHTTTSGIELGTNGMTPTTEDGEVKATGFTPGYDRTEARLFRSRIRVGDDGTATVRFRGTVGDATTAFVDTDARGRASLYVTVTPDDEHLTVIEVAVTPTGARVPAVTNSGGSDQAFRLGGVRIAGRPQHVWLLSVDGSADRSAYEAERAARRDARTAERAVRDAQRILDAAYGDDGDDSDGFTLPHLSR